MNERDGERERERQRERENREEESSVGRYIHYWLRLGRSFLYRRIYGIFQNTDLLLILHNVRYIFKNIP